MTNTVNIANTEVSTIEATKTQKTDATRTEICFGALMATATIAGIWGAVSLLISYFVR